MSCSSLLVHVRPEPKGLVIAKSSPALYADLRGVIELLGDDNLLTIGQFESAVFLLPDLAAIADGIAKFRDGGLRIQITLLESPPLWLVRPRSRQDAVELRHRGGVISCRDFKMVDEALELAAFEFLQWLAEARPHGNVDEESQCAIEAIASVWRSTEPLLMRWLDVGGDKTHPKPRRPGRS